MFLTVALVTLPRPTLVRFTSPPPANLLSRSEAGEATAASTRVHMPGRDQEATIESRMEGGERMRQYYLDHFQALIEAKPDTLEKKRGGDEEDKEIDK